VNKILKLAAILSIVTSLTTGCANHATGNIYPSANLSALKKMYVKHYADDNAAVNVRIADKLREQGVIVTTGDGEPPTDIDAVVTYVDRWMWDFTMYMLELTIDIRDAKSQALLASGNSLHSSLTRKSPAEMVSEVVNSIYVYNKPNITVQKNLSQKLQDLKMLKDDGTITEDEYKNRRKQLIETS
jgi:hypothetical protein